MQKYQVNQYLIEFILASVKTGEIAIPEIQRPFVWDSSKVRDLLDSLYNGYPIGYIITWKNPNVRLKDGKISDGKKILIDGQQRVTALTAGILGYEVVDKTYRKIRIKISFNPQTEKFEVQNPAIVKDKTWIADISEVMNNNSYALVNQYKENNPECDEAKIVQAITNLLDIPKKQVGVIDLTSELDIDTVTEIFIRINSKGVVLSQADFAMSKIASDHLYGGNELRKLIDYFCHLAVAPEFYAHIVENDKDFVSKDVFNKIAWLKNEKDDLYDPDYNDLLRVAFTSTFNRGKLQDLVSLLSGRDFENRTYEEDIMESSFEKLKEGVLNFVSETNFKRFLMIVRSAGFVSPKLLRSQNVLNFAYILYLKLQEQGVNSNDIGRYVRKWVVLSMLTGRYSSSPESSFDFDIKQLNEKPFEQFLKEVEDGELSDAFWNVLLPQRLDTSVASSPYFHVYLASQSKLKDRGFLSSDILTGDLITHRGDIHHLFPKDYLVKSGKDNRGDYNQVANYVYMQTEINIRVGNKSPKEYFSKIVEDMQNGNTVLTGLVTREELEKNLLENCVPLSIMNMEVRDYDTFLDERRKMMSKKIEEYYKGL